MKIIEILKLDLRNMEITKINKRVINFLEKYCMHFHNIDIEKQVHLFLDEMERGLIGEKSSLKMYPTFIQFNKKIPINKPVLVLDAGGTNLRSAIVTFNDNNKPSIENIKYTSMPGSKNEVSKDEFFKVIVENIKDIVEETDNIGFVFSYPIEIYSNRDAKLVKFNKEIKAKEVEGEFIGENLMSALYKIGLKNNKKIVILNDTVAALLSGISVSEKKTFESFIGFILGTGLNACYIEKNINIKNNFSNQHDDQIINIEAGNFSKSQRGKIDLLFDRESLEPGRNSYEKMFSGAYLGGLATKVVKFAIRDGLFSNKFSEKFNNSMLLESRDVDDFLDSPTKNIKLVNLIKNANQTDLISLYYIFDNLVERASILTSIVLSSAIIKSDKGHNPLNPVFISAEGSSFYKLKNFQMRVEFYMMKIFSKRDNYYYEIHKIDNAIMLGAAIAGLNN